VKNVIVIALGGERFAVELRWVREIFTLGHVTPVPTAPSVIAGATNFRGSIVPVLNGAALVASLGKKATTGRHPRAGDSVILLDVEDMRAAVSIERIDAVTTLAAVPGQDNVLVDREGNEAQLLDPPSLLQAARRLVGEKVGVPE
jgi:chemotaxis signal transduction protein